MKPLYDSAAERRLDARFVADSRHAFLLHDARSGSQALWRARDGISDTLKVARLFAEMAAISGKSRWPVSWEARARCRGKRGMVAPPISETAPRRFLRTEIMTVLLT